MTCSCASTLLPGSGCENKDILTPIFALNSSPDSTFDGPTIAIGMKSSLFRAMFRTMRLSTGLIPIRPRLHCSHQPQNPTLRRYAHNPADNPSFTSIVDNPPQIIKTGRRHGAGLIILSLLSLLSQSSANG